MDNKKYYTIFNYKMAKYLLRNGCVIADIGLNKKMKGIVFHFVNDEKLQKLIALKKDIIELQKKTREISQEKVIVENSLEDTIVENITVENNTVEDIVANSNNTENTIEDIATEENIAESTRPIIE